MSGLETGAFWTRDVPCEEALPVLVEKYDLLADELEIAWAERDEARRERDAAQKLTQDAVSDLLNSLMARAGLDKLPRRLAREQARKRSARDDLVARLREALRVAHDVLDSDRGGEPFIRGQVIGTLAAALASVGENEEAPGTSARLPEAEIHDGFGI